LSRRNLTWLIRENVYQKEVGVKNGNRCVLLMSDTLQEALIKSRGSVLTAKRLPNLAQGCRVVRLPWDPTVEEAQPQRGSVPCKSNVSVNQ
jgi:hypothetical protein